MAAEIQCERVGGVLVVSVRGRLDNESASDFELFAQETVAAGERHLLLDLSDLGYLSNAGARALATLAKSMNTPTTSLLVAGVQDNVRQVLDAAGVGLLLSLSDSREAALADHPAARGDVLGRQLLALLGVTPAQPSASDPKAARLAELAFELLAGQQHQHRAARAIAQGTQVMRRVSAEQPTAASARPKTAPAPAPAASGKPRLTWWKRLLGIRR